MNKLTVNIADLHTEASSTSARIFPASGTSIDDAPRSVPIAIPRDQEYFWSKDWQAGERQADADLANGDVMQFSSDDLDGMLDWLRSDD